MQLVDLLAQGQALPSMPRVVSEVLAELDAHDPDIRTIAATIATDPGLTARVLKLANSAYFGLRRLRCWASTMCARW